MQTLWSRRRLLSSISRTVSPSGALAECDAFFFLVVALFCLSLPPCLYYLYLLLLSVFSPRSLEAFPSFDHRVDHFTSVFFFGFIRRFTFRLFAIDEFLSETIPNHYPVVLPLPPTLLRSCVGFVLFYRPNFCAASPSRYFLQLEHEFLIPVYQPKI